ncbi:MAG: hypothetical protein JSU96_02625 [Acidobacteriota bacterium]|nr:MAG: hypothetical protein JSU96_02625 [Acidobacteriota bacterium]
MVDQPQAQRRSGRGCLKGCLVTILVMAILGAALVVGGYVAGKTYLEAQLPVWRARYPVVGLITDLMSLDREDPFKALKTRERNRLEGAAGWDSIPSDIPVFQNASAQNASVAQGTVTIFQEVPGRPGGLFQTGLSRFQNSGWDCSREGERGALCRKEFRVCALNVTEATPFLFRATEVAEFWVSCTEAQEAGNE